MVVLVAISVRTLEAAVATALKAVLSAKTMTRLCHGWRDRVPADALVSAVCGAPRSSVNRKATQSTRDDTLNYSADWPSFWSEVAGSCWRHPNLVFECNALN